VLEGHQRWVWDAAFSADSAYLVTGSSFLSLFLFLSPSPLSNIKLTPFSSFIDATASSDHVARLWELATGETVRQYNGHHRSVFPPFSLHLPPALLFLATSTHALLSSGFTLLIHRACVAVALNDINLA